MMIFLVFYIEYYNLHIFPVNHNAYQLIVSGKILVFCQIASNDKCPDLMYMSLTFDNVALGWELGQMFPYAVLDKPL